MQGVYRGRVRRAALILSPIYGTLYAQTVCPGWVAVKTCWIMHHPAFMQPALASSNTKEGRFFSSIQRQSSSLVLPATHLC